MVKTLQHEERRKAFEVRWSEMQARAKAELDEGTWTGPIVPIGLRPPEPRKPRSSGHEEQAEKKSFLALGEEPPEGLGKHSEGGSSGSKDGVPEDVPPPEEVQAPEDVPPPAPPPPEDPPEAPVAEAIPSKGDEVKQRIAEAPARLERAAYLRLEEEFIAVAKVEDLRAEDRVQYEMVRGEGLGVCARCRWVSGCQSCDERKAWGFACRSTLWHSADEALRPKAKPRGRPKKAVAKA